MGVGGGAFSPGVQSPSHSPFGSPAETFTCGNMPPPFILGAHVAAPPHSRQPLPVIAEPTHAEVLRLPTAAAGASGPVAPSQSATAASPAQRPLRTAAAEDGLGTPSAAALPPPSVRLAVQTARLLDEAELGCDSTERLLLGSSPPSDSLFPFAPNPP